MALVAASGFETRHYAVDAVNSGGGAVGSPTYVSTGLDPNAGGAYAIRFNVASGVSQYLGLAVSGGQRIGFRIKVTTAPSVERTIATAGSSILKLNSTGNLVFYETATLRWTSTASISDGNWHWIDLCFISSPTVSLRIDGTNDVTGATQTGAGTITSANIGAAGSEASAIDFTVDDWVLYSDTSFWGPTKVKWAVPVSDATVTNWRNGNNTGTTNLYQSVYNIPPIGVASANEAAQNNIESASNTGSAVYTANLTAYSDLGVGASDTYRGIIGVVLHGEDISTGTKSGSVQLSSNPSTSSNTFSYGNDGGAHGPSDMSASDNWWATATPVNSSAVTLSSSPQISVWKVDTTTRVGCVCAMGAYVVWTPSTGTTVSGSFTADAYIKKVGTAGSFTANANIRKTGVAGSFTADAFVKRLGLGGSFTADASVSKRTTQTFTADANIRRTGLAGSFTADSYIKRTGLGSSFTANAYLKRLGLSGSFTANAYVKKTGQPGSFTADAHIRRTGLASSFTADAFVKRIGLGGSLTADAYVKRVFGGSFTADAQIAVNAVTQTGSFTANAYIKKVQSASFTADANLRRTGIAASFTADSFVKRVGQSGSFTADAHLRKTGISATFTADAFVKRLGLSGSFVANAFVKRTGQPGSFTADAYIKRAGQPGSFTADAFVKRVFAGSFTADSNIRATVAGSLTSDAYIKRAGQAGSLTADAYIKRVQSASLTADAIIRKTGIGGTFTADAEVGRVARVYWTTPGNNSTIGFTPTLNFVIPTSIGPVHFDLQLDTVNTFDGVDFREYRSSRDQTGWEYWNGAAWTAVPQSGVPTGNAGNEARFTVPTSLSAGTWYRRIRAGA